MKNIVGFAKRTGEYELQTSPMGDIYPVVKCVCRVLNERMDRVFVLPEYRYAILTEEQFSPSYCSGCCGIKYHRFIRWGNSASELAPGEILVEGAEWWKYDGNKKIK